MDAKAEAKKALGVAVGVGVISAVTLLSIFIINYAIGQYNTFKMTE